ncbi:MAG: RhuM family protein [Chthoniobacteraceae bacterium]
MAREATIAKYATVQQEGGREVAREIEFYNLEAIIAVGYRVRSPRGIQFRTWASARLQEFLLKGFVMDDERLKNPDSSVYFEQLLARIRDIRSSEKIFWRKICDIYVTSIDYDGNAETSQAFFAQVQNKMHWAARGHTAAEVIHERADGGKPYMGRCPILRMTNQVNGRISPTKLQYSEISDCKLEKFRVQRGDILFNRTNSFELVGRTSIFDLPGDFVFASYLIRLRTLADQLNPFFLNLYLNADETQQRLKGIATRAVSQSNISATRLKGFSLPVPPIEEQCKIVKVLETVQRAIEQQERLLALTAELKKALLHRLFTTGLRNEPQKQTDIGPIPESWEVVKLGDLFQIKHGFAFAGEFFQSTGRYILLTPGHFYEAGGAATKVKNPSITRVSFHRVTFWRRMTSLS